MFQFNIELIKTDVTSLKIYKNYLLAGIGSQLHIYDLNNNSLLRKDTLFEGLRIHGIEINPSGSHILLNAENELLLAKTSFDQVAVDQFLSLEVRIPTNDWILSTKWLQYNNFVTVSMHNAVYFYNNETLTLGHNSCNTKCILYCASICFDTLRDCVVLSGTVFSEILIWRPYFSGEVLHRLKGHEGVLFSIAHLDSHILSTSDDRSVTLWKIDGNLRENTCEISIKHQLHGHTARVFCGKILTDHLLSAGEDGKVNIWDFDGNLVRTFNVHHGGCVWSLAFDESRNFIVSGGSDASITRLPLCANRQTTKIQISQKEIPKKLVLLHNDDVIVISESGQLMHYIKEKNAAIPMGTLKEFQSYALLVVSPCRRKIALAGLHGHIRIYSLIGRELVDQFQHCIANKKRIFAIHWLTCNHLLSCGPDGVLYLWKLHKPSEKLLKVEGQLANALLLIGKYELPHSKERWSTAACRIPKLGIVVGDRKGNLHFFQMNDTFPSHTIRKAHSHLGITHVYWNSSKKLLTSFGRNSTLRNYHINEQSFCIVPITSDVLPFAWLGSKLNRENVILGFSGNEMLLWDYDNRLELFKANCSGGHRSWDFHSDIFVYIRDKVVNCLRTTRPIKLTSSIHSTEMNTMRCLRINNKILFISGGEDTTLQFTSCSIAGSIKPLLNVATIKSHLSSIRCLHVVSKDDSSRDRIEYELVTAGGRGQIIYWLLALDRTGEYLFCKELHSFYEPEDEEIRLMDLTSVKLNDVSFLFAACSDGCIKVYKLQNERIVLFNVISYKLRCILKVCIISPNNCLASNNMQGTEGCLLLTMATDGHICFWNLANVLYQKHANLAPLFSFQVHKSGVNAVDFRNISQNVFCILTGGDDNQISFVLCRYINGGVTVLHHYTNDESHCAQITGAYLCDNYFFTASLDQKLLMFEYNTENEFNVRYIASHSSTISDIKGINSFEYCKEVYLVLYGLGIELVSMKYINVS